MKDKYKREIDYLRISVTDNCNLKCIYCVDENNLLCSENKLTDDEIYTITKACASFGIKKIRITGGEPLVRKNIENLIYRLNSIDGIEEIYMTTNGVLLLDKLEKLKEVGLKGINVSVDSLDRQRFKEITKFDKLDIILKGIDKALDLGIKVKINTVIVDDINKHEILDFVELTKNKNIDVRFIELMPIGQGKKHRGMKNSDIREIISNNYRNICEEQRINRSGPAKYIRVQGYQGKVGFISAISNCFCEECNRIRLTSEGFLKKCLHYNKGLNLKEYVNKVPQKELEEVIYKTIYNKPEKHNFNINIDIDDEELRNMNQIGG